MKKVITTSGFIILIIIGFLSFLKEIRNSPCKTGRGNKKNCIHISKYGDKASDIDVKYMNTYRDLYFIRIIISLIMLVNGILFFVIKK